MALARDTKENIDVHPGLKGLVSLNAIDETLPSILDRIAKQVNMRYRVEGTNHHRLARHALFQDLQGQLRQHDAGHDVHDLGQRTGGTTGAGGTDSAAAARRLRSGPTARTISGKFCARTSTAFSPPAASSIRRRPSGRPAPSATKAQREQRLAQAEAVARAGAQRHQPVRGGLRSGGAGQARRSGSGDRDQSDRRYRDRACHGAPARPGSAVPGRRAKLGATPGADRSDHRRGAVVPERIRRVSTGGSSPTTAMASGSSRTSWARTHLPAAPRLVIGYGGITADFNISIRMLEQFGNTRVLSSPKLMALNNQTALLKVVDNVVYFTIQSNSARRRRPTSSNDHVDSEHGVGGSGGQPDPAGRRRTATSRSRCDQRSAAC